MSGFVLLGAGGHASDVLAVLESLGATDVAVADDAAVDTGRFEGRARVLGVGIDEACALDAEFIASVGWPEVRRSVVHRGAALGVAWATSRVHPAASVHLTCALGAGSVVFGQTWISPHVRIGAHVHVGYGATIGHDSLIGDFSTVMPAASIGGDATLGEEVMVGANATVLQGVSIAPGAVVGAGAVVIADVGAGETVVGVPARRVG